MKIKDSKKINFGIVILLMMFSAKYTSVYAVEADFEEQLSDNKVPISIGANVSWGKCQSRDAAVPSPNKALPVVVNSFAFLADGKNKVAMPHFTAMNYEIFLRGIIINRSVWHFLDAFPCFGINAFFKDLNSGANQRGIFVGGGIDFTIFGDYKKTHNFYPMLGLGIGYYDAPISLKNVKLSHPMDAPQESPQFGDKASMSSIYTSLGYLFKFGFGYKYRFSRWVAFGIEMNFEFILLAPHSNSKVITVKKDDKVAKPQKKKIPEAKNGDFLPKKKYTYLYNWTLGGNIECTFNPAVRKYKFPKKERSRHSGEIGVFVPFRSHNLMSFGDHFIYEKLKKSEEEAKALKALAGEDDSDDTEEKDKINYEKVYMAVGIQGMYNYRIGKFTIHTGSELVIYDQLVSAKTTLMKVASNNSSRLGFMFGFGLDYRFLRLKSLLGLDVFSLDALGGDDVLGGILSRSYLKLSIDIVPYKHLCIGAAFRFRPMYHYMKPRIQPSMMRDAIEVYLSYIF